MNEDYEYNNRLNNYIKEIESLNQKNIELERNNRNLKKYLLQMENNNKLLNDDKKNNISRIKDLENEILKITENNKEESRILQKNLEAEILYYKGLNETGLSKIYTADKIIKLNETQHNFILKLEEKIDELKTENDEKMNQLRLEHERHYLKLKKQMLDYIQKAQQNMNKNNEYNLELNTKFNILYKNEMLNELEHQSQQIKELLTLKEKHEKMIYLLKQELETHKQVEQIVAKKKEKYLELFKKMEKNNSKKTSSEKNNIPLLKINKNCLTDRNMSNAGTFRFLNKKEYHDYKSLEKIYKELLEEYKYTKNKYITLKDKDKLFQNKYKGIINLFNEALEELLKDEEIKKRENIYININELNKGNYEKFTKEEKYYILVKLINHLLPLIQIDESEKNLSLLKDKINNIEFKMNKTQMTKFTDSSRCQTVHQPFLGITSNNFYNISTNNESNMNSNDKQQFVSIFGDDYIQYGKSIFSEREKSVKIGKNIEKLFKKKNAKKFDNCSLGDMSRNFGLYTKTNSFGGDKDYLRQKIENTGDNKVNKKMGFKRGKTFDRKILRVLIV